jgi:hypothetical protein
MHKVTAALEALVVLEAALEARQVVVLEPLAKETMVEEAATNT